MNFPMLFFIDIVPVLHFLGHLFIHLLEVYEKVKEDRQILIF